MKNTNISNDNEKLFLSIPADEIESGALDQIRNILDLNCLVKLAIMPDVHMGYDMPIGGVGLFKGLISPACVGYDIACTDGETEYLTKTGWRKIAEYSGEEIMVYDAGKNTCDFESPLRFIASRHKGWISMDNGAVNQRITTDHIVPLFPARCRDGQHREPAVNNALYWSERNMQLKKGVSSLFKTTIPYSSPGLPLSDDEVRFLVALSADGTIRNQTRVEFHFRKERKIARLLEITERLGYHTSVCNGSDGSTYISVAFSGKKGLSQLWGASREQMEVVVDEVWRWDGGKSVHGRRTFSSTNPVDIDLVQFAFAVCGIRANFWRSEPVKDNHKTCYTLYETGNAYVEFPSPSNVDVDEDLEANSYCFTTSTGFWVMRRGGKICITGNCGMAHQRVTNPSGKLSPMEMASAMAKLIPVGYQTLKSNAQVGWFKFRSALCDLPAFNTFGESLTKDVHAKANKQCGTLGSGNHFLEVGVNATGRHALTVHSGSRKPGHIIATYYMKLAKDCGIRDGKLWFFDAESDIGRAYLSDVAWATGYAVRSRDIMLERAANALGVEFIQDTYINEAHNTVDEMGDGTYLHRKGATPAKKGQLGIIPIHMQEGVYITRGLGHEDSLMSASHGAGRVMSRKKAKEAVHPDDVVRMMGEIGHIPGDYRDEHSRAYKSPEYVLGAQNGKLVDVIDHFRPVAVLKG